MVCCPFHDDRHPSMKVDRRFHCFACQADGDVIDFTSRLFGLSSKEAALKLAEDFSISFDRKGHDPPQKRVIKRKISEEMRYRQAEQKCFRVLCDYLRLLERWKEEYAPKQPEDNWNPLFVEALHRQSYIEYLLDLQGRRHSETDSFLSAGGICHDQICGKRVEVSSGAFCTRVIAFKIYCKIYALHRVIPSFAVRYFAFFSLSISF